MAIWLFVNKILEGDVVKLFNKGNMKRDFTYIDDIVDGVIASLDSEDLGKYEIFNLGNSKNEKLLDVVEIIEKAVGKKAIFKKLPLQAGDMKETYADISLAREKLGFEPVICIEEGILRFVNWYKNYRGV